MSYAHRLPAVAAVAFLIAAPSLSASAVAAESARVDVGDPFPSWELEDQHEKTRQVPDDSTEAIVFSRSKQADESLSPAVEEVAGERLRGGEVIYLSDISRMPGLVSRLFALPSLRDRDYPVVLIREEGVSDPLVTQSDCLALYRLEEGTVVAREDLCNEEDVREAL